MRILEIDAGNSRIKWRVREAEADRQQVLAKGVFAAGKETSGLPVEFEKVLESLKGLAPVKVHVSNVRGKIFAAELKDTCQQQLAAKVEFARIENHQNGISSSYAEPGSMGIDRWLAMQAVYTVEKNAACIVDCGSAMTIDLLDADGRHAGGFIVPGLSLLQSSLHQATANLPNETAQEYALEPGTNTLEAIQHGAINMQLGILQRVFQNWAGQRQWYLCGGDAGVLASFIEWQVSLQPDLVLDGLKYVCRE